MLEDAAFVHFDAASLMKTTAGYYCEQYADTYTPTNASTSSALFERFPTAEAGGSPSRRPQAMRQAVVVGALLDHRPSIVREHAAEPVLLPPV